MLPAIESPTGQPYQQSARQFRPCGDGYGRLPSPQVDRREIRPHLCMRGTGSRVGILGGGTTDAVVELGVQGPLASSPRFDLSPCPSAAFALLPQHLMVLLSCGEKQPRITETLTNGKLGRIFH